MKRKINLFLTLIIIYCLEATNNSSFINKTENSANDQNRIILNILYHLMDQIIITDFNQIDSKATNEVLFKKSEEKIKLLKNKLDNNNKNFLKSLIQNLKTNNHLDFIKTYQTIEKFQSESIN